MSRRTCSPRLRAFTLLEVIFALGLSLLLLTALLGAVNLYRQVSTAGRRDVEQAQLVRAILRSMEVDIRACTFGNPALKSTDNDQGDEATAEDELSEETTVMSIDPAEAFAGQSIGIFGDTTTLIIHVNRPTRDLGTLTSGASSSGDLKSIAYFLAVPGAGGLQGAAGDLLAAEDDGGIVGLARMQGDRFTLEHADATTDLQTMAESTRLLAAEVVDIRFRYFDGSNWQEAWDSVSQQRLPNAIEITIGFRGPQSPNREQKNDQIGVTVSATYRFVVAVPIAEPAVLEMPAESF